MLEFVMEKQAAKIAHINLREEMHGDDPMVAIDVKVSCDVSNDFLSYLNPTLKWSMYDKQDGPQIDMIQGDGYMPKLRYPELKEIRWDGAMYCPFIIHGAKKSQDLEIDADINNLRLDCKDGGTVALTFRVQTNPTDSQSAALVALLGKDVKVSVRPASEASDDGPKS